MGTEAQSTLQLVLNGLLLIGGTSAFVAFLWAIVRYFVFDIRSQDNQTVVDRIFHILGFTGAIAFLAAGGKKLYDSIVNSSITKDVRSQAGSSLLPNGISSSDPTKKYSNLGELLKDKADQTVLGQAAEARNEAYRQEAELVGQQWSDNAAVAKKEEELKKLKNEIDAMEQEIKKNPQTAGLSDSEKQKWLSDYANGKTSGESDKTKAYKKDYAAKKEQYEKEYNEFINERGAVEARSWNLAFNGPTLGYGGGQGAIP